MEQSLYLTCDMGTGEAEAALMYHICKLSFTKKAEEGVDCVRFEKYTKPNFSVSYNVFIWGI